MVLMKSRGNYLSVKTVMLTLSLGYNASFSCCITLC